MNIGKPRELVRALPAQAPASTPITPAPAQVPATPAPVTAGTTRRTKEQSHSPEPTSPALDSTGDHDPEPARPRSMSGRSPVPLAY